MVENMKRNDPYQDMERSDIRPGFLADSDKKKARDERRNGAAEGLRGAEENAAGGMSDEGNVGEGGGLAGVAEKENNAGGLYTGVGKIKNDKKGGKGKGFFKRKGPMALIIGLLLGAGGLMGGSQLLMPFSLVANYMETFNSMHISTNRRSNVMLKFQTGKVKYPMRVNFLGKAKFSLSNRQKTKLSDNGIDYVESDDTLVYTDKETGEMSIITTDDSSTDAMIKQQFGDGVKVGDVDGDLKITELSTENGKIVRVRMTQSDGSVVKIGSFDETYKTNMDFRNSYNSGSMTWRGAISNWFGDLTIKFLMNNRLTRNLFNDFRKKLGDNDGDAKATMIDLMAKGSDEVSEGGFKRNGASADQDEDGNIKAKIDSDSGETVGNGKFSRASLADAGAVRAKLESIAETYGKTDSGGGITGAAQAGVSYVCLAFNVMGGISLLVSASEALQIIHLITAFLESVDKVKAGNGDGSPMNEFANSLTSNTKNVNTELVLSDNIQDSSIKRVMNGGNDVGQSAIDNANKELENNVTTNDITTDKSAMGSSGIVSMYSNTKVNPNDPSVQSFNFTKSIKTVLGGIGVGMASFTGCSIAKLVANAAGVVETGLETASCIAGVIGSIASFGLSLLACLPALANVAISASISIGAALLVSGIVSVLTPWATRVLARDLITNIGGEDLGNALTSGANMYMGNVHRSNGGSLSNANKYQEFAMAQSEVIAEDARYERSTRSPFDVTSQYTFMGSLLNQMTNLASVSSLMSAVTSTNSVLSSSIVALTPTATAYDISNNLIENYDEVCPYLASVGAVGDAYCNPYAITDISTINEDPSEVIEKLAKDGNFLSETDSNGNVKIKGDSDLAKYILFCDNRSSAFGIADQNVVNQVANFATVDTSNSTFNNVTNAAIGAIPIVGDGIDIVNNAKALANAGYVSGESCVAGNTTSNGTNWEKAKEYQRFIEDQSLMETMGMFGDSGKSAVSVFLDEYYEENPLDNSYEGILARYSGLTKDTVVALLDFVDYSNYIADYDASERYAFGAPVVEKPVEEMNLESENLMAGAYILTNDIVYADVRNRVALV